jgi:hypothetical protein
MAVRVEVFQPYHIDVLMAQGVQPQQVREVSYVPPNYASLPKVPGAALTARRDDGFILLCGGVIPESVGMGRLWALLSEDAGAHFVALHRAVGRFIETQSFRRIETTAETGFPQGCRWLKLLGFEYEGDMKGYGPGGETHMRFAKVR